MAEGHGPPLYAKAGLGGECQNLAAQAGVEPSVGHRQEIFMLKGGLLWLIGIPIPIILLLLFFGFL
jgi:hypothetical protein